MTFVQYGAPAERHTLLEKWIGEDLHDGSREDEVLLDLCVVRPPGCCGPPFDNVGFGR